MERLTEGPGTVVTMVDDVEEQDGPITNISVHKKKFDQKKLTEMQWLVLPAEVKKTAHNRQYRSTLMTSNTIVAQSLK